MMFGKKQVEMNEQQFFVKLDGQKYTESDMEKMTIPEIDRFLLKIDMAINECETRTIYLDSRGADTETIQKVKFACKKLRDGKNIATAIKRMKQKTIKLDLEHFFIQCAKRELTENQFNRIMVKAQAEYELQ